MPSCASPLRDFSLTCAHYTRYQVFCLATVHRQADEAFKKVLKNVREGQLTDDVKKQVFPSPVLFPAVHLHHCNRLTLAIWLLVSTLSGNV